MLHRSRTALVLAAFALVSPKLIAQTADRDLPNGKELVAVYVGASTCGPCLLPEVKAAIVKMKGIMAHWARERGYAFSAVGVATDWSTEKGVAFLSDVGPFDQLVVGGNWANLGVERFVWSDSTAIPAMPQVVLLERTVTAGNRIAFTPARVIRRVSGLVDIPGWVSVGAPVEVVHAEEPHKGKK
jgi:hypothetical protein